MCLREGEIAEAAIFRIFPEILSTPTALEIDKTSRSLWTLLFSTVLKKENSEWVFFYVILKITVSH